MASRYFESYASNMRRINFIILVEEHLDEKRLAGRPLSVIGLRRGEDRRIEEQTSVFDIPGLFTLSAPLKVAIGRA